MKITIQYMQSVTRQDVYAHALKLVATAADDKSDPKIFVYHSGVPDTPYGITKDEFSNVAAPLDMFEIPADKPDFESKIPYYRKNEVVMWFRCLDDLATAKRDLEADINTLCKTFDFLENEDEFTVTETKTYGQ